MGLDPWLPILSGNTATVYATITRTSTNQVCHMKGIPGKIKSFFGFFGFLSSVPVPAVVPARAQA